jgi:hypothetical protein
MLTNCTVTIYHRDRKSGTYMRDVRRAWLFGRSGARVSTDGFAEDSTCVLRIPTMDQISASVGDLLILGEGVDIVSAADLADGYSTIMTVTDNRRGGSPHWRIDGRGDGV